MPTLHRGPAIAIRPYRPADQPQLRALHDRTPPKGSRTTGTQAWFPDLDHITDAYLAFLVAVEEADEGERLIGMVGITLAGPAVPPSVLQAGIGPWWWKRPPTDRRRCAVPSHGLPRCRPLDDRAVRAGVVRPVPRHDRLTRWFVLGPHGIGNRWFSADTSGHSRQLSITGHRPSNALTSDGEAA
jgi:hypothetical protein